MISVLVFVSCDFKFGRVSVQFANAFAITITGDGGVPRQAQSRTGLIFLLQIDTV